MSYELTGCLFEDRQTVADALDDPNLSSYEKQKIVEEHNWKNIDNMSTDTYTNHITYGVTPTSYSSFSSSYSSSSSYYSSSATSESDSSRLSRLEKEEQELRDQNKKLLKQGRKAKSPFPAFLISLLSSIALAFLFAELEWYVAMPFGLEENTFYFAFGVILYIFLKILWLILKKSRIDEMGQDRMKEYERVSKKRSDYLIEIAALKEKIKEENASSYTDTSDSCACNGTGGCY